MRQRDTLPNLLQAMQPGEREEFGTFLDSPFFNAQKGLRLFFDCLCRHYPKGLDAPMKKSEWLAVYKAAFPGRDFNDHKLDNLTAPLSRLLEDFFVVKQAIGRNGNGQNGKLNSVQNPPSTPTSDIPNPKSDIPNPTSIRRADLLSQALAKRDAFDQFNKETTRLLTLLENKLWKDPEDFLHIQQLHHRMLAHPQSAKFKTSLPPLEMAMQNLDLFFCLTKLEYAADMKNREHIMSKKYGDIPLLAAAESFAAALTEPQSPLPPAYKKSPLPAVFLDLLKLHDLEGGEPVYQKLKQRLAQEQTEPTMSAGQRGQLLLHLFNFTNRRQTGKPSHYLAEKFELYRMGLDNGLLITDGKMSHLTFTNIASVASGVGAFEWGKEFIENYKHLLLKGKDSPALAFAMATLLFAQGRHPEAQLHLANEKMDLAHDFRLELLRICNTFELMLLGKSYRNLLSRCEAFSKYMHDNKNLHQERSKANFHFMQFFVRLIRIWKSRLDRLALLERLRQDILAHQKPLVMKSYLLEKIEKLEVLVRAGKTAGDDSPPA